MDEATAVFVGARPRPLEGRAWPLGLRCVVLRYLILGTKISNGSGSSSASSLRVCLLDSGVDVKFDILAPKVRYFSTITLALFGGGLVRVLSKGVRGLWDSGVCETGLLKKKKALRY